MSEKVVFLAYDNPNAPKAERDILSCANCKNKTYIARCDLGLFPELYCAACGSSIGAFGWAEQDK